MGRPNWPYRQLPLRRCHIARPISSPPPIEQRGMVWANPRKVQVFEDFEMPVARGRGRPDDRAQRQTAVSAIAEAFLVRVATYNIHTCIGVDRRYDPGRIGAVLREIDADIACLQEVDTHRRSDRYADQWAYLGEITGRRVITGAGIREHR